MKTTQVYTRVSLHKLKAVHGATHPGAPLKSRVEEAAKEERSGSISSTPKIRLDDPEQP